MLKEVPVGQIVQGDVLEVLPQWPEGGVDLVFADPPFNIRYQYDKYRDDLAPHEYLAWTEKWIDQCLRALKPTGTFWIAIGDEYAAEIRVMMRHRATLRNWVIWRYTFGQCCKGKFNRGHAHLFYFVKDPKHFTFNADAIRVPSDRQLKYDDLRANPKGKLPDDVWTFSRVCGTFKERVGWHPCQMPVTLLARIIMACSKPGDVVLDPFAGSGTTLLAAARLGRKWAGVELSEQYAAKALERVHVEGAQPWQPAAQPVVRPWRNRTGPRKGKKGASAAKAEAITGGAVPMKRRKGRPRKVKPAEKNLFAPPEEDIGPAATGT